MIIKLFMFFYDLLSHGISFATWHISSKHDKLPLPPEVANIYEPVRYQAYLNHKSETKRLDLCSSACSLGFSVFTIFSPFYHWIERLAGSNVYIILLLTFFISSFVTTLFSLPFSFYQTFIIDEKYNLNKYTKKEFFKDEFIDFITDFLTLSVFLCFIVFICRSIGKWLLTTNIAYGTALLICIGIFALLGFVLIGINAISIISLRLQYRFSELPEGDLKEKIKALTAGSKKKIKKIQTYNESSKSTSKNAFLLRFLWYREFGIADNFLNENSERELLAVLAHEAGHLRYKKTILDYVANLPLLIIFAAIVWIIPNAEFFSAFDRYIQQSFNLQHTNYYLILTSLLLCLSPFTSIVGIFSKYLSRKHEYDADAHAVNLGYGKELKETFEKASNDELANIYPSPLIEFLEYSHPGMYNRIKAINEKIRQKQ